MRRENTSAACGNPCRASTCFSEGGVRHQPRHDSLPGTHPAESRPRPAGGAVPCAACSGSIQVTTDQRAQEDGALCAALPLAEYREALCSDLGFLRYASRRLARIVVMNTFRATNDLLLPLENRLAAYLLSQAEDGWFHGTLTRTAETLSTSYRQLTRVMSRFAQAGYLRRTPEGWRLEDPDALRALAESVEPSRIL